MLTFILGTGVDFVPVVDQDNMRKRRIEEILYHSKIELYLPDWASQMICAGRILLYLRSDGTLYQIHAYPRSDYRLEHGPDGQIVSATIRYSYRRQFEQGPPRTWWVQLRITSQVIARRELEQRPDLYQPWTPDAVQPNPFGFVPVVECLNVPPAGGRPGEGDFDRLAGHIEAHEEMVGNILDNIAYFSQSPIVSTREAGEVQEQILNQSSYLERESVAYVSGFTRSGVRDDDESSAARYRRRRRHKLKRFIGGFEPDEMIQQLNINPVPQDHVVFADQYERQLREALGGILERGIETATESRVVYGKVASTAARKQKALFKYGLCQLLSMALLAEEALFLASGGELGLPYLGDRTIQFRVGAVYQPTTRDTLDRSIVSRNLMRQGVNAKEALKQVFPDKSESEIAQLVSSGGMPTEFLNDAIAAFGQLVNTFDPATGLPIQDPRSGVPLYYSIVPLISQALEYGSQFAATSQPVTPASTAAESGALAAAPARVSGIRAAIQSNQPAAGYAAPAEGPTPGATVSSSVSSFFNPANSPILNWLRRARP